MKLLIVAAIVAVAVADYHDDTYHFSTLGGGATLTGTTGFTGLSTGLQTAGLTRQSKQYTVQAASPVYSSFSAQPAYTQKYSVHQVAQPAYSQYSAHHVAQPAYSEKYAVHQVAQPTYSHQYAAVKELAAKPVYAQQYSSLSGASSFASSGPQVRILSQVQESDPAGPYKLSYSTENGIQVSEQGALSNGAEGAVVATQGSYSYTGTDGQVYTVNWIADENGYRASGDHLPVSPPIPAEILKSLEEISRSGNKFDEQGRLL